jgi:hypothetical protein
MPGSLRRWPMPMMWGGLLFVAAQVWLVAIACYAGAWDPGIARRTVELPYYALIFLGLFLLIFQIKVWIYQRLTKGLRKSTCDG